MEIKMNNKYKILIVEDEVNIARFVTALLEANDYSVIKAETAEKGLMIFLSHLPDLVVLDLGLPDRDGTYLLKEIRKTSTVPVMVLSARSDEKDKVEALDAGANDYVTKPFGSAEFAARVRSILRNTRHSAQEGKLPGGKFTAGDMIIDYDARKFFLADQEIKLTQTEFNIMALLSEHFGKVMTYSSIAKEIWGYFDSGSTRKCLRHSLAIVATKENRGENTFACHVRFPSCARKYSHGNKIKYFLSYRKLRNFL